jgi:hypothetical protein
VRQKNNFRVSNLSIFLSHIFLSSLASFLPSQEELRKWNCFDEEQERSYEEITFRIIADIIVQPERDHIVRATAPEIFDQR